MSKFTKICEENSNYPMDRTIKWKSPRRSFQYYIVKEGVYPPKSYRAYTRAPNCYPIPDNYVIETTYGKKEKTITCYIDYYNEKPQYTIKFGLNKDEFVCSDHSPTDAANAYLNAYYDKITSEEKAKDPNFQRPKTKINGVYLFGLQLSQIKLVQDNRKKPRIIKPFSEITNQMQTIRCRSFSTSSLASIEDQIKQHFSAEDEVAINELTLTVNNSKYRIIYQSKNDDEINRQLAIVRALDYNRISRSSYRALAAICQDLPRDRVIYEQLNYINKVMNKNIPIYPIKVQQSKDKFNADHEIHITDPEIINEVEASLGNGVRRSIKDTLNFLIPSMIHKGVLNYTESTLYIRVSGDGRNVGHKVKHVMVTFTILNNTNIFKSNSHFALLIYPGIESYSTLRIALAPLIEELHDIKAGFIDNNGHKWKIELYISADWKFLSICLGHKSANSANFCLWCSIDKSQNGILEANNERQDIWTISKSIDDINRNYQYMSGHKNPPLFSMIPICNWVVDELHLMLRIFDRLWTLVLSELRSTHNFTDQTRQLIVTEMNRIQVQFQFWEDHSTKAWIFTSLTSNDKLKILRNFNLNVIFTSQRATIIKELWDGFNDLYNDIHTLNISGSQFHQKARQWLKLFLTRSQGNINSPEFIRGLYRPTDITPYIHVLVYHVPEFMDIHRNIKFSSFSCCGVEKKNYDHVLYFFKRSMKDGGTGDNRKSAIFEIMEYENRSNFFYTHNIPSYFKKNRTINEYPINY